MSRINSQFRSLAPSKIRFTQDSVAMVFQNGNKLNETCENIVKGEIQVESIPAIEVFEENGKYYSADNRRLYVWRVLEELGFLTDIKVKLISRYSRGLKTTKNDGCHVRLRQQKDEYGQSDKPFLHCSCFQQQAIAETPEWWDNFRRCHKSERHEVVYEDYPTPRARSSKSNNEESFGKVATACAVGIGAGLAFLFLKD